MATIEKQLMMELISMGFEPEQCKSALQRSEWNLSRAVDSLLNPSTSYTTTATCPAVASDFDISNRSSGRSNSNHQNIHQGMQQQQQRPPSSNNYEWPCTRTLHDVISGCSCNVEEGHSFPCCTLIALLVAEEYLSRINGNDDANSIITPPFLESSILRGVEIYQNLRMRYNAIQYASAGELWNVFDSSYLTLQGSFVQWNLFESSDYNSNNKCNNKNNKNKNNNNNGSRKQQQPQGNCRGFLTRSQNNLQWTAVLIARPPETVLCLLPPSDNTKRKKSEKMYFILVDSRARPHPLGSLESYARFHTSMDSLVQSLNAIFHPTSLGPNSPPLAVGRMYNPLDLYCFRKNRTPYYPVPQPLPCKKMIHCPASQYSVEGGRSACTLIALQAAESFLSSSSINQQDAVNTIITPSFLQSAIEQGVQVYRTLREQDSSEQHKSAEEVLPAFPSCRMVQGGVVQGVLVSSSNTRRHFSSAHPQDFQSLLKQSEDDLEWTAALITKPPETVLCLLPPAAAANAKTTTTTRENNNADYILVDSHPRPYQFGSQGSYARFHSSLEALIQSLNVIFPYTDLGLDCAPLMAEMYNQFDLYRFRASSSLSSSVHGKGQEDEQLHALMDIGNDDEQGKSH